MDTLLSIASYAAVAVGYIAMIVLTERSAARYVRGETKVRPETRVFVVNTSPEPARQPVTSPATVHPLPATSEPTVRRIRLAS